MAETEKAALFVADKLNELERLGFGKYGGIGIGPNGQATLEQMKADGYEPSRDEAINALRSVMCCDAATAKALFNTIENVLP